MSLLFLASCTEVWDSHYDVDGRRQTATRTLWEEISARPELADFADVVRQTGYLVSRQVDRSHIGSYPYIAVQVFTDAVDNQVIA